MDPNRSLQAEITRSRGSLTKTIFGIVFTSSFCSSIDISRSSLILVFFKSSFLCIHDPLWRFFNVSSNTVLSLSWRVKKKFSITVHPTLFNLKKQVILKINVKSQNYFKQTGNIKIHQVPTIGLETWLFHVIKCYKTTAHKPNNVNS